MHSISVCIIAKDEEQNIERCIRSVKPAASEIVLVDTGSSDKTVEISKRLNCKVFHYSWRDDFSAAKNFALEKASGDLILSIDADEVLKSAAELRAKAENAELAAGGWLVNIVSYKNSDKKNYFTSKQIRLFRNDRSIRFEGIIHEQVIYSILNAGYEIKDTNIIFEHFGYMKEKKLNKVKFQRNLKLLNKAIQKEPEKAYNFLNRSKTNLSLNALDEAEKDALKAAELSEETGSTKPNALNYAALTALKKSRYAKAESYAKASLDLIKEQITSNLILADVYSARGEYNEAAESYLNLLNVKPNLKNQVMGDMSINKEEALYKAGIEFLKAGKYSEAEKQFREGIDKNQAYMPNYVGLANAFFKLKNFDEAYDFLVKAKKISPDNRDIDYFLEKTGKKLGKKPTDKPLLSLSMIVKNEEEMLPGCLESVKGLVDEIVIVDTGSSDRTKEIAGKFGAKIFDFKWIDDFSAARNEALKHSTGEWILYMDADERLKAGDKSHFRKMLSKTPEDIGALVLTIESEHSKMDGSTEKHRGGYPRIFRNYGYPKIQFKGAVHEQIAPSILELDKSFLHTDIVIEHLGYNQSYAEMEKKVRRNYKMLIKQVQENPVNGYAWYQLSQTLARMKMNKEAEDAVRFALQCGDLKESVYASATATLAQIEGNKKNFKEALKWAEESLNKAPGQIYAGNIKAYALLYLNRFDEAEREFEKILKLMDQKQGIPKSGFDIEIPRKVPEKGLKMAREREHDL